MQSPLISIIIRDYKEVAVAYLMSLSMKASFKFMPEGGGIQYSLVIQDILWNYKYFMIIMEEVYLDWDPDMVSVNIPLNSSPFTTVMSLLTLVQTTLLRFTHHKLTTSRTCLFLVGFDHIFLQGLYGPKLSSPFISGSTWGLEVSYLASTWNI